MRPYPRTEPSKTAQQWAFEGKQTPELTPGGVNRPPRSRPRPALRGGVHGPRESFDPRPLSCYNFDRAFWVCQGALGWGAVSARESPQGAVWDGCDPGGADVLAARGVPAANGGGNGKGRSVQGSGPGDGGIERSRHAGSCSGMGLFVCGPWSAVRTSSSSARRALAVRKLPYSFINRNETVVPFLVSASQGTFGVPLPAGLHRRFHPLPV